MDKNEKKIMFKLSPELSDGDHWTIVDNKSSVLEAISIWCDEFSSDCPGESFSVETVEMSQAEVEALPEI